MQVSKGKSLESLKASQKHEKLSQWWNSSPSAEMLLTYWLLKLIYSGICKQFKQQTHVFPQVFEEQ